jgi:hypothetical protein
MNYLQLCQKAHTLCGLQGSFTSVSTTTTYQVTLAKFVAEAWEDIQNLRKDWPFLRSQLDLSLTTGKTEYTLTDIFGSPTDSDVARWLTMCYYTDGNNNIRQLRWISYDEYIGNETAGGSANYPGIVAADPVDRHLYFNPLDTTYTVTMHYITLPVTMTSNTDEPLLPPAFHNLIAYQGAAQMCAFMGNTTMYNILVQKADVMLGELMRSEIPSRRMNIRGIC